MISRAISWGPAVLWAAVLFFMSALPDGPGTSFLDRIPAGDKLAHAGAYSILGACLAWGRSRAIGGSPSPWVHAAMVVLGALYGASDEWHQSFVPGRDVSALDWLADLAGVTLGYFAASAATPASEPR